MHKDNFTLQCHAAAPALANLYQLTGRTHGHMQKETGHAASISKHEIEKIVCSFHI